LYADTVHERFGRMFSPSSMMDPGTVREGPERITTWYLGMPSPGDLKPRRVERSDVTLNLIDPPWPALSSWLYRQVGARWQWVDRLPWSERDWLTRLEAPGVETWLLSVLGMPAGYFELQREKDSVEIVSFGLIPRFIGQGLGAHLLTLAVERAWAMGARRVWLHTCSLDHPAALANYQARGFQIEREEINDRSLRQRTE
jgi:GNAT superfamily N-acetyltransferase